MPVKGKDFKFTPYSSISEVEVGAAIKNAKTTAIEALLIMLMGDPDPEADPQVYGIKRCAFRHADLMPMATDPESMTVELRAGSALINDGEAHAGNWYLVHAAEGAKSVVHDAAHATLDRYDVIYAVATPTNLNAVTREVIDGQGNVSEVSDHEYLQDDFTLYIQKGTAGAGFPQTGGDNLNPQNAWQAFAPGQIPIAVVKVPAGATTVIDDDITDLREIFALRTYPINGNLPAGVTVKMGGIIQPNHPGQPYILLDAASVGAIPEGSFFDDKSATGLYTDVGVLKYKKVGGTVISLE